MDARFQAAAPRVAPSYRGRFAPSPTGALHAGSLLAALGSWLFARHAGGEWLVRMDDLDPPREVPGMAARQLEALQRFGLVPDGPVLHQSTRGARYAEALQSLVESGDAFECRCTRSDLDAMGGVHHGCVAIPSGRRPAWRLRLPDLEFAIVDRIRGRMAENLGRASGDVVLRRADGPWAYQLAVVVDDADQGITEVVRGADLLDSSPRQAWLQQRLGLPTPGYAHLPLLRLHDGSKLSKSAASAPVDPGDPMPALRRAWDSLGQAPGALAGAASPDQALARALAAFEPLRIPATDERLPAD
jgi:glutamyl-Q tRNA(Asp) synthetase